MQTCFKGNLKYDVIAGVLFFPRSCILGFMGRENQRGEGEMTDANGSESEIKRDCCECGLSTLATDVSVLLGERGSPEAISDAC